MLRKILISTLFVLPVLSYASTTTESEGMETVLKKSDTATEEQLDAAAEQIVSQELNAKNGETKPATEAKVAAATNEIKAATGDAGKTTAEAANKSAEAAKTLNESQIPVLRDEKTHKTETSSPWFRLIGGAVFMITIAGVLIFSIKKYAKKSNVGGRKAKIEVIHQHFLGPKKSVALIQVAGEAILIGVTDNNINMIKSVALIDDEMTGENQDFNGFLEDEFTVENLTAQRSKARVV